MQVCTNTNLGERFVVFWLNVKTKVICQDDKKYGINGSNGLSDNKQRKLIVNTIFPHTLSQSLSPNSSWARAGSWEVANLRRRRVWTRSYSLDTFLAPDISQLSTNKMASNVLIITFKR